MARAYRRADQRNNDAEIGLSLQPVEPGRLDGEPVAAVTSFGMIQLASDSGNAAALVFFLFDLLYLDGEDVSARPLIERKARLAALLSDVSSLLRTSCSRPDGTFLPHSETPMEWVLRTGNPARDMEVIIERPDTSRVTVLVNIAPLFCNDGKLVGAVNCFQDLSAHERAERERARLAEELHQAKKMEAIGQLTAGVRTTSTICSRPSSAISRCSRAGPTKPAR
jgi:hypothetical protein